LRSYLLPIEVNQLSVVRITSSSRFESKSSKEPAGRRARCADCSTLKMEAICSPQMSVDFKETTRLYIPEDRTLQIIISLKKVLLLFRVLKCLIFIQNFLNGEFMLLRVLFDERLYSITFCPSESCSHRATRLMVLHDTDGRAL
jgi:hypothetical protein